MIGLWRGPEAEDGGWVRALLEQAPITLFLVDAEGRFEFSAGKGREGLARTRGDVTGRSPFEVYRDVPWVLDALRRGAAGATVRAEGEVDGVWFEAYCVPVRDARGVVTAVAGLAIDRTELNLVEQRLRESETRFRALAEASFEAVFVHEEGRILYANPAAAALFGYAAGELVGKHALELTAAATRATVAEHIRAGFTGTYEAGLQREDGTTFTAELRGQNIRWNDRVVRVTAIRDVSERREHEQVLRRERDFTAAVLDTVGALVVVLDREGRIVKFNRACEETTGWSARDAVGRRVWEFLVPEEADGVGDTFRHLVAGDFPNRFENHWVTRDGRRRLIAWTNTCLTDERGHVEHIIATGIDVTERRRAEAERDRLLGEEREARRRSALLAEASAQLADTIDLGVSLPAVAGLVVPLLGDWCVIDLLEDGVVRRIAVNHPDPRFAERLRECPPDMGAPGAVGEVLRGGRTIVTCEHPDPAALGVVPPDHRGLVAEAGTVCGIIAPLVVRGRVLGALTCVRAREGCHPGEAEVALIEDVARRAAFAVDNARLHRAAQDAVQLRDEFLSVASHELYTPLTSLLLAMGSLTQEPPIARDHARRLMVISERQIQRLSALVGDLLDVSRVEMGRVELRREEVDLGVLAAEVVSRLEADAARAGSAVRLDVPRAVVGRWDRSRVEQVVTNLLTNAIKYGQGRPIEIQVDAGDGNARLVVRDHGIGIEPVAQARIFERFQRAASSRHFGGLGLGLYICRRIVEAHGGTIGVSSCAGAGATFTVELPRGEAR